MAKSPSRLGFCLATTMLIAQTGLGAIAAPSSVQYRSMPFRENKLFRGTVSYRVSKAESQLLSGNFEKAESSFRAAVARDPKDVRARAGLGFALAMEFKIDGADQQLDQALRMAPGDPLAHTAKSLVLLNKLQSSSGTIMKNRQSILSEAEQNARQAISADPQMPEAHYMMGAVLKEEGKLAEAASEFHAACQADPKYSAAFAQLGLTHLNQGKLGDANADFKRAISINSKNSTAHFGLGKAYLQQGQADAAVKELNTALYLNRNSAPVHLAQGEAFAMQGNSVGAMKEYQEAIRIKPEMSEPYIHIADLRESRGDLEHAIAELHSGLAMNPDSVDLHRRVGELSLRDEKIDDAIKEFKQTLALSPNNQAAVEGLTTALYIKTQKEGQSAFFATDDFESAEQQINEAIALAPNNMMLRLADARLRSLSGKPVDLSRITPPTNDGERVAYAELLMSENRFGEATQQFNTLIGNASNAKQTFAVADLASILKDLPSAEAAYTKARSFPGSEERAKRGLSNIAKIREESRKHLTLGRDLARKSLYNSSVDQLRAGIYENPKDANARLELAEIIPKQAHPDAGMLRDAANQYKAYLALSPQLTVKETNKIAKHIESLEEKANKVDRKAIAQGTKH